MRLIISPFKNPLFHTFKPILSFLSLQFLQLGILFVTVHAYLPDLRATDPCVDTCWKLTKYTFKWKITLMSWTNPGSSCFIVAWKVGGKKGHELLIKFSFTFRGGVRLSNQLSASRVLLTELLLLSVRFCCSEAFLPVQRLSFGWVKALKFQCL